MRAEAEGVPPRDMENSDTGPSYIPLGTALSTASYGTNNQSGDGGGDERNKAQEEVEEEKMGKNKETLWRLVSQNI